VAVVPGTLAARLYETRNVTEPYYCTYGLNGDYRTALERAGVIVSGTGTDGEARIIELPSHPFFLATLFLPQARSSPGQPHPVIAGLAAAART
jgi:CTP synthase (UTP-ammonia lyase)